MVRVLVTGGAGFIGKHLVRALLEKNYTVTIFDNFSNSTKDSISSLVNMGVKIIEGDITKPVEILSAVKEQNIVIHLAAKISVQESIRNPSETFRVNVNGTKNILVACEKNNIKKLIVASSAAVYGEGSQKLTEESQTNPISPYGESKLKMEEVIKKFVSNHDISCIILRFFNIYGVGQSDEYAGVITKFRDRIVQNKSLEILGDGKQIRDFVSIYDIINSIHNSIFKIKDESGIYNIASGKAITIKELADLMISIYGKKIDIKHLPQKNGDIRFSQADISLAKKKLGYFPKIELREGVKDFWINF